MSDDIECPHCKKGVAGRLREHVQDSADRVGPCLLHRKAAD